MKRYRSAVAEEAGGGGSWPLSMSAATMPANAQAGESEAEAELRTGHAVIATEGGKALSGLEGSASTLTGGALSGDERRIQRCVVSGRLGSPGTIISPPGPAPTPEWDPRDQLSAAQATQNWMAPAPSPAVSRPLRRTAEGAPAPSSGPRAEGFLRSPGTLPRRHPAIPSGAVFEIKPKGKSFVRFPHDVTARTCGSRSSRGLGLGRASETYTTIGLATDQARIQRAGASPHAEALGKPIPEVRQTASARLNGGVDRLLAAERSAI